jgi:glyoxylase-like metal-dependent hydrolase (beta-lactamase superfamily II)
MWPICRCFARLPSGSHLSPAFRCLPEAKLLLSGDLVQPKGEVWDQPFYPSPYPYFTDGQTYLSSLEQLLALDFDILVTGHREVRFAPRARQWVELTRRAIAEVGERVKNWSGAPELDKAAREIFVTLCRERAIPEAIIGRRMAETGGGSSFQKFDLPGIADFWHRFRGER